MVNTLFLLTKHDCGCPGSGLELRGPQRAQRDHSLPLSEEAVQLLKVCEFLILQSSVSVCVSKLLF